MGSFLVPPVKSVGTLAGPLFVGPAINTADLPAGTTHNWNPPNLGKAAIVLVNPDPAFGSSLSGLAGGIVDRVLWLVNNGSTDLTLLQQDAGSLPGNQFDLPATNPLIVVPQSSALLWYDTTLAPANWMVLALA